MYTITRCLPLLCLLACEYSDTTGDPLGDAFSGRADATLSDVASGLDSTLDMVGADRLVIDMGVPDMLIDGPRDGALDGSSDSTPVPLDVGMDTGTLEQLDLSIREPPDLGAIPDIGEVEPDQAIPQPMNVCGDGRRDPVEDCDDGNLDDQDGCDSTCSREHIAVVKGLVRVSDRLAAGSLDRVSFEADGPSILTFRAWFEDQCVDDGGPLRLGLMLGDDGRINDEALIRVDDERCPWTSIEIPAGRHHLEIDPLGDGGRYDLDFRLERRVSLNSQFAGAIEAGGNDRYVLDLDEGVRVRFETSGPEGWCAANTWITLFRQQIEGWVEVDFDADGAGGGCSRLQLGLQPGRYALVVRETRRAAIEAYRLVVMSDGVCGDGALNLGEECDDGNLEPGDGCSPDCLSRPICGDGVIDVGETCDDGNLVGGDGCSAECQQERTCGNRRIDPPEECDDGNDVNGDGCDLFCSLEEFWIVRGQTQRISRFAAGGFDRFNFMVDGPARLDVSVRDDEFGCRPSADSHIALFGDVAGGEPVQLAENDDDPANPPCSRLNVDLGSGSHHIIVSEILNRVSIDRYILLFRLVRDINNARQIDGGFPDGGSDRYTFQLAAETPFEFGQVDTGRGCERDLTLEVLDEHAVNPLPAEALAINGCTTIRGLLQPGRYDLRVQSRGNQAVESYRLRLDWGGR